MKLISILTEATSIDDLEKVVRDVYLDEIKKQMKKMKMTDDKTHSIFFVASRKAPGKLPTRLSQHYQSSSGKTLADKIKNKTIKALNATAQKKPDVLARMDLRKAEKEIRTQIAYVATEYMKVIARENK